MTAAPAAPADHVTLACAAERLWSWNRCAPDPEGRCVVYWMAHAQRSEHNLAFDTSLATANDLELPLLVLVDLAVEPPENDLRHVSQMVGAFPELAEGVVRRSAAFAVRGYGAAGNLAATLTQLRPTLVVTDEDAMPHARAARKQVAAVLHVPLVSVDADVIVPNRVIGARQYAARTLRPRIHRVLAQFEGELGAVHSAVHAPWPATGIDLVGDVDVWHASSQLPDAAWVDTTIAAARAAGVPDIAGMLDHPSGMAAARAQLHRFVADALDAYAVDRNQPHLDGTSGLSTFLHYGQISPHEVVQAVRASYAAREGVDAFIEEFVVRRELAWNYVLHTPNCRAWESLPEWARLSLELHAGDVRPALHSEAEMVACATRDPLWNAAQAQMRDTGLMHGYLRMYWAKQILTWTRTPQEAFDIALRLHDRYSLDGRDPNSVVGVSWAIGGVHDRAWPEREVFGKVRSMTFASTGRKFDKAAYIERWSDGPAQLTLG